MPTVKRGIVAAAIGVLSVPLASGGARAQDTSAEMGLEEIVVTAQRRSESLANTPVSVAVISSEQLARAGITTEADLATAAPGLLVQGGTSSNQLNYVIRGQATEPFSGIRPGVLPYFNEVQISSPGGSGAFYDMQSVQVLKGPQGTLFGRNSTGGAVLYTTAQPYDEWSGYLTASGGNYDYRRGEGAVNIPIAANVASARIAGFIEQRDGFQDNVFLNREEGDLDRYGVRASFKVQPIDTIENTLVVDYFHADESNTTATLWSATPNAPLPLALLFSPVLDLTPFGYPGAWNAYVAAHPGTNPNGVSDVLQQQRARGAFTTQSGWDNAFKAKNVIVSNVTTFALSDALQLKNIIGYGRIKNTVINDPFGTPYAFSGQNNEWDNEQLSEELQLQGSALSDKLSYTAGVYYSKETAKNDIFSSILDLTPASLAIAQTNAWDADSKTYAGYAQGTYDLSEATGIEGLAVTLGARYTSEEIGYEMQPNDTAFAASLLDPAQDVDQSRTFENLSWVARIEEQLTESTLLYLTYRRAYRNGGFNGVLSPVVGFGEDGGNAYKETKLDDFEVGFKYQGSLGSLPARVNLDAFHTTVEDDQRVAYTVDDLGRPGAVTVNVPEARIRGVELDGALRVTDWLEFGGSANYTDAEFTKQQVSILGRPPIEFGTYPYAPEFSAAIYVELDFPVYSGWNLGARLEQYEQDDMYFSSTGNLDPNSKLPSYGITNFRVGVSNEAAGWSVNVNLRNAFDKEYFVGGANASRIYGIAGAIPGAPRTVRLDLRYDF